MRLLADLAAERGGLIPTFRLRQSGLSPRRIAALCHAGRLVRVRQGWFVLPGTPRSVVEAVRVGGQLTCSTALALHGVWVHASPCIHVAVNRHATQLRSANDPSRRLELPDPSVVVHWRRASTATTSMVASVADALDDYARCAPLEHLAASVDSALRRGLLSPQHPAALALRPLGVVGICESGTETVFWLRMRRHRLPVARQVRITTVGRVDFLIGERLVIEVDGRAFHDREAAFEEDRQRDAQLSILGYRVLRFSYRQVFEHWELVEAAVMAAVGRGDHLP
ncbi:MAG: DUF559 domain-containing protein [Microcella sp.]